MTDETIVAVFDTMDHAAAAVQALEAAGVPSGAIKRHAEGGLPNDVSTTGGLMNDASTKPERKEAGFWSNLFGSAPEYEHEGTMFDRRLAGGSTVITVQASEAHIAHVIDILEQHHPLDVEEHGAGYGAGSAVGTTAGATPAVGVSPGQPALNQTAAAADTSVTPAGTLGTARSVADDTISLSEESLVVGKREVNRGTTRVRRYVVETPVEQQVTLRDETVSVERRPVTDARPVEGTDFTDRVVEVTETAEEAVVGKTARVAEEVVIRKQPVERTETIKETVRREDIEVTKDAASAAAPGVASTTSPGVASTTSPAIDPKI